MKKVFYVLACAVTLGLCSCDKEDDNLKLQDISVDFAVSEAGMEGNSTDIGLKLSRISTEDLDVTLQMTSSDVSSDDITLTPALVQGQVVVTIPAGQSTGSFSVAKAADKNPEGSVKFRMLSLSATDGYKIGTTKEMTLSFSPIVSSGSKLVLEGNDGETKYANMVYVDLSNNSQEQVKRKDWNLGFYCGDEFRVLLNSSYATVAVASGKTDFAAVTLEDAQAAPNLSAGSMSEDFSSAWIDDVAGDLSKTAFGTIAEKDADNQVFFVASENNKSAADGKEDRSLWYKVKVTRKDNGYLVEYGKAGDTSPKTVEIAKDPLYNIVGLSLESGVKTKAQAEKRKWDIMWAYAASATQMATGLMVISFTQDVITSNVVSGVETAVVMIDDQTTYDNFKYADIASKVSFEKTANVIGTGWRTPAMPGVTNAGVKTDRFYVVKDVSGNYYKLRFTKFGTGTDGTERGRPEVEYALLK